MTGKNVPTGSRLLAFLSVEASNHRVVTATEGRRPLHLNKDETAAKRFDPDIPLLALCDKGSLSPLLHLHGPGGRSPAAGQPAPLRLTALIVWLDSEHLVWWVGEGREREGVRNVVFLEGHSRTLHTHTPT